MRTKLIYPFLLLCMLSYVKGQDLKIRYELSKGQETSTYQEVIDFWQKLDATSSKIKLLEKGPTDSGYPLHLVLIDNSGEFDIAKIKAEKKAILMVNNGIHPGEPDGIDASMLLARDIAQGKVKMPDNLVLAIIPVYNIGGALNQSNTYRVDQNGPNNKGSRGNGQNYDLNRDYIKADSKNARSFIEIFHELDPDVFIDNHVSNGADYQHVMTLLTSQHNKLGGEMGEYLNGVFEPALYKSMKAKDYDLIPYVNVWGKTPDEGWNEYFDSPRYSSGYGTLWSTFCFVPESHMLKPYNERVEGTYELMRTFMDVISENSEDIINLRKRTVEEEKTAETFPISWTHNPDKFQEYLYTGYAGDLKTSEVSGLPVLYYDRSRPFSKMVPIYNVYDVEDRVEKPEAYIIPQGWWKVIDLLQLNGVKMSPLEEDKEILVETYYIENYKPIPKPFEGHYLNTEVKLSKKTQKQKFRKGDMLIPMNQRANRFLIETLEAQGMDSFFAWNFFDSVLQNKEWFSPYAFEDIAAEYLKEHPEIRKKLDEEIKKNPELAEDAYGQLRFVYQNSPWSEPEYMRYPVYRVPMD